MNFIASFYSYSVTSSIYDLFSTPLNNFLSDGVVLRLGIVATIIFSFTALMHIRKKISFFNDKTDALLTIFAPILSALPIGILWLIFFIFEYEPYWISSIFTDLYSLTLLFFLFCSFRFAKRCNPNSLYGFCLSCFGRLFSIVAIFTLLIGFFIKLMPDREYRSVFEEDYVFFRNLAILTSIYSGLIWVVLKLTRKDEWSDPKAWLILR